jgi:hypothetical protein
MFMVRFDGGAPDDKADWIAILGEALAGELGSYHVRLYRAEQGWRFALDWRPEFGAQYDGLVANSPASVAYNIYQLLVERGKPVDPDWKP